MNIRLIVFSLLLNLTASITYSQIGIGTNSPNSSSIVDLNTTNKALLLPRLTSEQRSNISNPANGLVIYCSDCGGTGETQVYSGTSWKNVMGGTVVAALPIISTSAVSNISYTTITAGGIITYSDNTISARGVCWSTSQNPTTANTTFAIGTGSGVFSSSSITGLTENTTYYLRAYATNTAGTSYGSQVSFTTLTPTIASFASTTFSAVTGYSATISSTISSQNGGNITTRGVCWSTSANPTTANNIQTIGSGSAATDYTITTLAANTTYFVRSYAINSAGTAYSDEINFTTGTRSLPTLTTTSISAITTVVGGNTASSGGNISSSGNDLLTARGVCWSTSPNPTILNTKTSDGTATGTFTSSITGLTPNTTYYVRAYATNSVGTAYGSQVSFLSTPTLAGSLEFNGTNGYLGLSPGFTMGTGAFTIEGWFYTSDFTNKGLIGSTNSGSVQLYFVNNQYLWAYYNSGGGYGYQFPNAISANTWHYLVYNRNSDKSTAIWIDGTNKCNTVQIDNFDYSNATDKIGYTMTKGYFSGKLTNLRVSVGTAVYNSASATIANPVSELNSLAATKYLMLGGSVTSDASNTQTVTNNGTVGLSALKPF